MADLKKEISEKTNLVIAALAIAACLAAINSFSGSVIPLLLELIAGAVFIVSAASLKASINKIPSSTS